MARPPLRRQAGDIPADLPGQGIRPAALQIAPVADVPSGVELTRGLRGAVEALRSSADAIADREAAESAWNAGTTEGDANPGAQMQGGGALYRTAFNRAAVDSAQRRLEISSRDQLARLFEEHQASPDGFAAAAQAWRDGTARGLPDPIRSLFVQRFDAAALPFANQTRENLRRRVSDDALATFAAAEPGRVAAVERAAAQAVTDPQAAAALAAEEENHLAQLAALGPREAFTIGGRSFPADPSRAGALTALQVAERWQAVERTRNTAAVTAAWRAAGGGQAWIADFVRNATGGETADAAVMARIFRAENAAGDSRRNAMGSSASGPGQITNETWRAYAGRLGLSDAERNSRAAHERIFQAYMGDAERAVGRPLSAGEQYGAWFLGIAGLRAFLAAGPNADARQVYATVVTPQRLDLAFRQNPGVMQDGMTTGQVLAELERRIAPRGRGAAGTERSGGMPVAEVMRIATHLRSLAAADEQTRNEGRAEARAELNRLVAENLAAIGEVGEPTRPIDPALVERAGGDLQELIARETAAREAFVAQRTARDTTDPAELARLAEAFAPGTANFRADPRAAVALRAALRARGAAVAGSALDERVRDLEAEAAASGRDVAISAEEAAAAGVTPERRDQINAALALTADLARRREGARELPPAEREAALAALPVEGPEARENAQRLRVLAEAFQQRDRAVAEDAAAYALAGLPRARAVAAEVARGETGALGRLVGLLRAEQERLGVPEAQRRDLPRPLAAALFGAVVDAADADRAEATMRTLAQALGPDGVARLARDVAMDGGAVGDRRQAIMVAAALAGRNDATAREVLRGAFVLRDNPLPDARAADMEREMDRSVGAALARQPELRSQVLAAARALYAAGMNDRGALAGAFDRGRFAEALDRILPSTRYGGAVTLLPAGMDARRFRDVMAALPAERLEGAVAADGQPITPALVARGGFTLEAVEPSRYLLRYGQFEVLDRANPGRPFVLDLSGAEPSDGGRGRAAGDMLRGAGALLMGAATGGAAGLALGAEEAAR